MSWQSIRLLKLETNIATLDFDLKGLQRKWQIWIPDFRSWSQG